MVSNNSFPTLANFQNFHGMLIRPTIAKKCIDVFRNGKILFMPSNREKGLQHFEVKGLDSLMYYGFVFYSFTGLSTLLGLTDFIESKEDFQGLKCPEITEEITNYIGGKLKIVRRFEYNFRLPAIRVKMYHLTDENFEALHLVEIYEGSMRHLSSVFFTLVAAATILSFRFRK